jgi:hypothetical protein
MEEITFLMKNLNLNKNYKETYGCMGNSIYLKICNFKYQNNILKYIIGIEEEEGRMYNFSLRKNGQYVLIGENMKTKKYIIRKL